MQNDIVLNENEIAIAEKVLQHVIDNDDVFDSASMRNMRKKIAILMEKLEKKRYNGLSAKEYLVRKQVSAEKKARIAKQKNLDKNYIDKTLLRAQRKKTLNGLLQNSEMPLIADGAVDVEAPLQLQAESEYAADELHQPRSCYTCKVRFVKVHEFYDLLCPECAALNYEKRFQSAELTGKTFLVTGSRVKIGYQTTLKLLLAGATVIATTRFPQDCAARFAKHEKFSMFKNRLQIFGVDFRDIIHLEQFLDFIVEQYDQLHGIINNACSTIRRPPAYYRHLIDYEMQHTNLMIEGAKSAEGSLLTEQKAFESTLTTSQAPSSELAMMPAALKSQITTVANDTFDEAHFPKGELDVNGQQIDLRRKNSWLLKLGEVSTPEVSEVFAINALAPFIINNKLAVLLDRTVGDKFVVNVSAMEGKFYRFKTPNHPHNNMAKAALNMMTRTCSQDLSVRNIYMNSVDTGWINDENPLVIAREITSRSDFQTPLDEIDAAARILDPVFMGFNEESKAFGLFYKDYHSTEW